MAVEWGSISGHMAIGLNVYASGTEMVCSVYLRTDSAGYNWTGSDNVDVYVDGPGSNNFSKQVAPDLRGSYESVYIGQIRFEANPDQAYTFVGSVSGLHTGGSPTFTRTERSNDVPKKPSTPTASSVTEHDFRLNWSMPGGNGVNPTSVRVQLDNNSNFSSPIADYYDSTPPSYPFSEANFSGAPNTVYYARIAGHVAGFGTGPWSNTLSQRLDPDPPSAPSTPSVSRNSDTSHTVSWTRNASGSRPYTSQKIQRAEYNNGSWGGWVTVATLGTDYTGSGSHSYTDTGTKADRVYHWRIQATNAAGTATSGTSDDAHTTPQTPSSVNAVKTSSDDIKITITNAAESGSYQTVLERQADGGSWTALATLGKGTVTYTHVNPNLAQTHRYRAKAVINNSPIHIGDGLSSGYRYSSTVELAAPPDAPTNLGPTTAFDLTVPRILQWRHNPVDTSPQSKFQIRHREAGSGTWTTETAINGDSQYWELLPIYPNGSGVEWQVRTWGEHPDPSPYSATAAFTTSATPTVAIAEPADGAVLVASKVTVEWNYLDDEGTAQAGWKVTLIDDASGEVVETKTGSGAASSITLDTVLPDDTVWHVEVQVRDGSGLWSSAESNTFSVGYALPPKPEVSLESDPGNGGVIISAYNPAPDVTEVEAVTVDLWRSTDDGPWELVAEGLPADSTTNFTDWSVRLNGTSRYVVNAVSALPSVSQSDPAEITLPIPGEPGALWLNKARQGARALHAVQVTSLPSLYDQVLHRFDGAKYATEFSGEAAQRVWQISAGLLPIAAGEQDSTPAEWLALGEQPAPLLLRTPDGIHAWCSVSNLMVQRAPGGAVNFLSFTATEVSK